MPEVTKALVDKYLGHMLFAGLESREAAKQALGNGVYLDGEVFRQLSRWSARVEALAYTKAKRARIAKALVEDTSLQPILWTARDQKQPWPKRRAAVAVLLECMEEERQ